MFTFFSSLCTLQQTFQKVLQELLISTMACIYHKRRHVKWVLERIQEYIMCELNRKIIFSSREHFLLEGKSKNL